MLQNNLLAAFVTLVLALAWLRLMDWVAHRGWISSKTGRKIIHITTGPLFVICWLLFNDENNGRWLAALVPLGITVQFLLVGIGIIKDEAAVQAISRTGDRREILRGPLYYGIIFVYSDTDILEIQSSWASSLNDDVRWRWVGRCCWQKKPPAPLTLE